MQIGEPSYKKCPYCGQKNEYFSGPFFVNFYGLTEWSDGETFRELPSLKETKLQKCDSCNQFYWFKQKLGGMSLEEYIQAIEYYENEFSKNTLINFINRLKNKRRLLYIRLNILRRYNDQFRVHPLSKGESIQSHKPKVYEAEFIDNAKSLIGLLTEIKPDFHFLIAELYRNIGEFEKAKEALGKLSDGDLKKLLLIEIEHKNCNVIIIKQPTTAT